MELSKEKKLEIPSVEARAVPPKQSVAKPKTAVGQPAQDPKTSTLLRQKHHLNAV